MVSEKRILENIMRLSSSPRNSRTNPVEHAAVGNWISDQFEELGLAVERQQFEIPSQDPARVGTNIIATTNNDSEALALVIGAHYDTVPESPGADDNASGIAAMLECARALVKDESLRKITFIAFDAEEIQPPVEGLHGSEAYLANLPTNAQPTAAIIFESIGFSSDSIKQQLPGSFRFLFRRAYKELKRQDFRADSLLVLSRGRGRHSSRNLEISAEKPNVNLPLLPVEIPWWMPLVRNLRRSDHAPFWKAGIPAVMISDTANFRNPHYHQPTDTHGTVDPTLIAKAVRMVLDAINDGRL